MRVSMDLLIWTDAHMQSRAKIHRVAMLTKNFVKFHVPNVLLRCSSYLSGTFWRSLTPEDNIFGMSSSPFDCNRSPDSWRLGFWDSLRPSDEEACCALFGIQYKPSKYDASGSVTREFLVELWKYYRSPDAWLGFTDFWHRNASLLELCSMVSSCRVALQPARELFCFLASTLMTRQWTSERILSTDNFG